MMQSEGNYKKTLIKIMIFKIHSNYFL